MERLQKLARKQPRELTDQELLELLHAEEAGGVYDGELPFEIEMRREKALDSPSYFASHVIDPFYQEHFEYQHQVLLDEVLKPWVLGEELKLEGAWIDPKEWVGLLVTWPRSTYKSTCLRLLLIWAYCYFKLKLDEDLTCAFMHQVLQKSIDHGDGIKVLAKVNAVFRETFPEFAVDPNKEWDTKPAWRWPHMDPMMIQAANWSWTSYGMSSSKFGGHYKLRLCDDWETEDSVTTAEMINQSERMFRGLDNLKVRGRPYNPWLAMGTYYHYDGCYKRLEKGGGWLNWRLPAHKGSAKAVFDLVALNPQVDADRKKIQRGLHRLERDRAGDLNFPKLLSWRELYLSATGQRSEGQDDFKGGHYEYSCQLQLDPVPAGEERFDLDALECAWVDEIPSPEEAWFYIRVDPAISKSRRNDETAIIGGLVKWNGHRYSGETWIGREKSPGKIVRRIFTMAAKWKARGYVVPNIGIESVAYQEALAELCREGVPERAPMYQGESVPMMLPPAGTKIVSITRSPNARKQERILEMDGPVTRREVHFWADDPMGHKLHHQFTKFPLDRFDGLDGFHDLWVKTKTPPRKVLVAESRYTVHPELRHLLVDYDDPTVTLRGVNNTVKLSNWGS